jgi:hypothetical protein
VVEQGLFSKSPNNIPASTNAITQTEEEIIEDATAQPGSIIDNLKNNLFLVILVPMVLIEIVLLLMVMMQ